jgi:curli biogenesis system outer membrane secretion channel CsgG
MKKAACFSFVVLLLIPSLCLGQKVKTTIAVNDLAGEGIEASEARIISDRLRSELINSEMFRVMERGEMETILKEQGFQQSGLCTDQSCMVEMGKILGVRNIIAGTIGKIGGMYTISTRMIDVATGEVKFSVTLDCKCAISDVLTKSVPTIAQQIVVKTKAAAEPPREQAVKPSPQQAPAAPAETQAAAPEKKKSLFTQWYFWVPAAALVAGGAVAGYVVLSKKNQEPETQTGGVMVQW